MVRRRNLFFALLAGLVALPWISAFTEQPAITIDLLTTFDYPGAGNSTTGVSINDRGEIAGFYTDSGSITHGFVRFSNGNFSAPIDEPDGSATFGFGINNSRTVSGYFIGAGDGVDHGFLLSGNVFTQFDIAGAISTLLERVNDAGDLVGGFTTATQPSFQAFANIDGSTVAINIAGSTSSFASAINASRDVSGYYSDSSGIVHGFLRNAVGMLRFPIDFPGATMGTVCEAINDRGWIVGRYTDSAGVLHGMFFVRPTTFVSFDVVGAAATSLNGINRQGIITGRYTDASGIRHGLIARVRP